MMFVNACLELNVDLARRRAALQRQLGDVTSAIDAQQAKSTTTSKAASTTTTKRRRIVGATAAVKNNDDDDANQVEDNDVVHKDVHFEGERLKELQDRLNVCNCCLLFVVCCLFCFVLFCFI